MRIFAGLTLLCTLAALLCARYLAIGPYWYISLYALPLTATLFAIALTSALFEHLLGTAFRAIAPALGFALMLFAVLYAAFERAPGVLPTSDLRLSDLPDKALSIAALGAAAGALVLALHGLRSPLFLPQLGSSAILGGGLYVARETTLGFGLPFLSWWSSMLIGISLVVFVFSAGMRRRSRPAQTDEDPPSDPPALSGSAPGPPAGGV